MSKSAAHLRLVACNPDKVSRAELARAFRQTMAEHLRAHTDGTNVNAATLLATDYLNHFNEAIMLLEMLPEAPAEAVADLAAWRPETYEEHFHRSGFRDKGLAIAGYRNAPDEARDAFDTITGEIAAELSAALRQARAAMDAGDAGALEALRHEVAPRLQAKVETAGAIVNGRFASKEEALADAGHHPGAAQAEIDALFE